MNTIKQRCARKNHFFWGFALFLLLPLTGVFGQGSIGGVAWLDKNQNGLRENDERGFSGIKVTLMKKNNESVYERTGQYETENTGFYIFIVPAGEYYVQFDLPAGYEFSKVHASPADEYDSDVENQTGKTAVFKLDNNGNIKHLDAGYIQTGGADLSISKQAPRNKVLIGQEYNYIINVVNNGPDQAINVALQNGLSPVVELIKVEPAADDLNARPLRWFLPFLAVGQTWSVEVTVRALTGGADDSRCCVSTTSNDPNPSNNCDDLPIDLDLPVELSTFEAKSIGGMVKLLWITESETENAGFLLYRSETWDGPYERINETIVEGLGTTPARQKYEYQDKNVKIGQTYYYKLADMSYQGQIEFHGPVPVLVTVPQVFRLMQNYPNPFNSETRIPFVLQEEGFVRLDIYNLLGQKVRSLIAADMLPGEQNASWNGLDDQGISMTSGAYLYVLQTDHFRQTKKMHLVR
jgi:uncharacterized repeat protein (TIGR01451 family)